VTNNWGKNTRNANKAKAMSKGHGFAGTVSNGHRSYGKAKGSKMSGTMGVYRNNTDAFNDKWSRHRDGRGNMVNARNSWRKHDKIKAGGKAMGIKNGLAELNADYSGAQGRAKGDRASNATTKHIANM